MSAADSPRPWEVPPTASGNTVQLGPLSNAFAWWVTALVAVVVIPRLVIRKFLTETGFWWDDFFITAALVVDLIGAALDSVEVHYHLGTHEHYVTEHDLFYYTAYTYGEWIQTFLVLALAKISIAFFLLRMSINKKYSVPLKIFIAITGFSHLVLIVLWIAQCAPVQAIWNPKVHGKCFTRDQKLQIVLAQAIISIFGDFALALYPTLIFSKLNMSLRQKIGLSILMGLGVIAGSCGIVRAVLNDGAIPIDSTFGGLPNWFWRLFEVNLGIICACIPSLIPGFKWVRNKVRKRFTRLPSTARTPEERYDSQNLNVALERRGWRPGRNPEHRQAPREPEPAVLASRTDRAVLGRAYDMTESSDDLEAPSISNRAEAGSPLNYVSSSASDGTFAIRQNSSISDWERRQRQPLVFPHPSPIEQPERSVEKTLDVSLEPRFEEHRSIWKEIFKDNRFSWMSKSLGFSTQRSKDEF